MKKYLNLLIFILIAFTFLGCSEEAKKDELTQQEVTNVASLALNSFNPATSMVASLNRKAANTSGTHEFIDVLEGPEGGTLTVEFDCSYTMDSNNNITYTASGVSVFDDYTVLYEGDLYTIDGTSTFEMEYSITATGFSSVITQAGTITVSNGDYETTTVTDLTVTLTTVTNTDKSITVTATTVGTIDGTTVNETFTQTFTT